jgi:hypothetical protein
MNFSEASSELLHQGISILFPAQGRSMHPAIHENDILQVDPVSAARIKTGDIVLCNLERGTVVHRVTGVSGTWVRICGDSPGSSEELVSAATISGRVRWIERNGRRILLDSLVERVRWRVRYFIHAARSWFKCF